MLYINDSCTDPYWNLAAEEYLLKEFSQPIFRLWRNDSSIIIGQYQNALAEIDYNYIKEHNIKVVRRLTGGGAVFHDLGNLNFTFVEARRPEEDAPAMFRRFTAPILDALNNIGVKAYLEGRNDLLIDGRKFSGNAVCIHKERILQHGTLLFSASMNTLGAALKARPEKFIGKAVQSNRSRVTNISEHLANATASAQGIQDIETFKDYLAEYISSRYDSITPYNYTPEDLAAIESLREGKYATQEWNFGKSPSYTFSKVSKLQGGIVEIYMDVAKGAISSISIMGDYFFSFPTEEFTGMLTGTPHTQEAITGKILEIDHNIKAAGNPLGISAYFSNITPEEIAGMFFN